MQASFLAVRDTMGLPSMLLTIVTGSLIIALSQQHKYPYRFIYLICFCQACSIQYLFHLEDNLCCSWMVPLLQNFLVADNTPLAKLLGFSLTSVSELQVAGLLLIGYTFFYHLAVYLEILMTLTMSMDVISTVKSPFDRVAWLNFYLKIYKLSVIVMTLYCLSTIPYALQMAN